MTKVSVSTEIDASADELWNFIGTFNGLPDWHPAVTTSELENEGQIRKLGLVGGGTVVERLERIDDDERVYSYAIVDSPYPVSNYVATIRVRAEGDKKAIVEWSSEFNPAGASANEAMKTMEALYQAGFDNLRKLFGG